MDYTNVEWEIQEVTVSEIGGIIQHYYITGFIGSKTGRTIADVGCWTDRENALEDAHLIAASPKLYEALKAVRPYVDSTRLAIIDKALAEAEEES